MKLIEDAAQAINRQLEVYALGAVQAYPHAAVSRSLSLPYGGTGHPPMLHFVRFKDDRYHNAVKTFGRPDFIHRFWDHRAVAEVMPGDVVIFAEGDEHQPVSPHAYDDSAFF